MKKLNKNTNRYTETVETWNQAANLYEEKFMNLDIYNTTYDTFCNLIETEKTNILELGCGPGNITKYLISKRPDFNILGLDASPNMIELASKNNPTANFKVMDVRFIEKIEEKFDAIVCGFIIPYLSKKDRKELIENCRKLIAEKGILYLSFVEGKYEQSKHQKGSDGSKMFFYYHELNKIKSELIENEFQILNNENVEYKNQNGIEIHTILIAKFNNRNANKI